MIDENGGLSLSEKAGKVWDDGNAEARKKLAAQGNKVLVIKDAEYKAMVRASAGVEADWIKQATAKGLDSAKLATEVHSIGNKYLGK